MTTDTLATHPTTERIDVIDALRGFALAGVLLVNLGSLSLYEFLPQLQRDALPTAAFDRVALMAMQLFVDVKAITLFSLLFGIGFALQLDRAAARGNAGLAIFVRRMAILFAIGLAHMYLLWWGDILATYAVVGFLLILLRNASQRMLIVLAVLFALVLPPLLSPLMREVLVVPRQDALYAATFEIFSRGDYFDVLRQNAAVVAWARVANWALLGFVLGRFLLGYWAGRRGLLGVPQRHRALLRRIFWSSLVLGIGITVLHYQQSALKQQVVFFADGSGALLLRMVLRAAPLALGIAYAAGFVLLFLQPVWRARLQIFAPVGRMALTNYLTQSLLGVLIFYGVGLGIGVRFGVAGWLAAWLVIYVAQIVFSRWWLQRFRYGPMEWVWRCLTYGALQPLRRASNATADTLEPA